jgi:hypothetical protein
MTARLLATISLLCVSASLGRSESLAPAAADVDVYLKTGPGISPAVLDEMKSELALLMQGIGARFEWRAVKESGADTSSGFAVVVELRGQCGVPWHGDWTQPVKNGRPLASSAVVDGDILPFSWVDCAALNRLVGPAIEDQPGALRDFMYGRAVGRLLAHELYHVLMQTADHAQTGIAKAQFTAVDLLSERFQFAGSTFKSQMAKPSKPVLAEPEPITAERDDPVVGN